MKSEFNKYGLLLDKTMSNQFEKYYELLIDWNQRMNLTTITDRDEVVQKHFIDSVLLLTKYDKTEFENKNIIDVGTGAGFPGIPLKIVYPEIDFVLVDSLNKRVKFLKDVKKALGLEGLEALHGRAEDLARDKSLRAAFDLCVSRAVANLSVLSEYCVPFVRTNGYFVSYKGKKGLEEISNAQNCMNVLGCKIEKVDDFRLEEDEAERLLIRIKKCKGTPKLYPRKAGTPSKNPL